MSEHRVSSLRAILKDERGQMLPIVAFMLITLLGVTGFVIDVGRAYVGYRQLQSATDASALAAAGALPDNATALTNADNYSAKAGKFNAISTLNNVGMVASITCLKTLQDLGLACIGTGGGNAVVVKQTGTVKMTFGALIGFRDLAMTATATAAMSGAVASPYNVAIVVDSTASMNDTDSSSTCKDTRINCALGGIKTMLLVLDPCPATAPCGTITNGNVANPVDKVSIFTYPNITTTTVGNDSNCSGNDISIAPYTFPLANAVTYTPGTSTYQVVGYSSDYKAGNSDTALSSNSTLSSAIGFGPSKTVTKGKKTTTTPCPAMQSPGGEGTYFAGTIYAAQASLLDAQSLNSKTQNVMIILSDGDASASASAMPLASTTSGTYPSTKNQCAQAVTAAKAATAAGTKVYTVAYGALSTGCSTDSPKISPCQTMANMASDASKFFSDYTATGGDVSCTSAAQPTTSLDQIFTEIAGSLTLSRLIPDGTK
jgi:Flp pilus assembly protein TadG